MRNLNQFRQTAIYLLQSTGRSRSIKPPPPRHLGRNALYFTRGVECLGMFSHFMLAEHQRKSSICTLGAFNANTWHTDPRKCQTSGWTESSRTLFHPGAIMSIATGYIGFAPSNSIEVIELACHYLGEGREYPQRHISNDGVISGFVFNFIPRVLCIADQVRQQFPEITAYADNLRAKPDFDMHFNSEEARFLLIQKIEKRFGRAVYISSLHERLEGKDKVLSAQQALLSGLAKSGKTIYAVNSNSGSSTSTQSQPSTKKI